MTSKITVSATAGWPVDVTQNHPGSRHTTRVPAGQEMAFYVHSGADLLVHEVQPGEASEVAVTHQGLPVAGYREQTGGAVGAVNANKAFEEHTLRRLDELAADQELQLDGRWFAIGRTAIEQGWMAINRAIFKPGRARLPEDGQ